MNQLLTSHVITDTKRLMSEHRNQDLVDAVREYEKAIFNDTDFMAASAKVIAAARVFVGKEE